MKLLTRWLPVVLWAAVIVSASTDSLSAHQSGQWLDTIFGTTVPWAFNVAIRKLGHITEYAILGALAWRADRRFVVALAVAVLVASIDETKQTFTATRTGTPWDVLLDACGATLGILLLRRFTRTRAVVSR
jgi:hypothetical protein